MGLIIESTENKKILITGTDIELQTLYGRVEFAARANGKTLEIALSTFASLEAFEAKASVITTSVPMGNLNVELEAGQAQDLDNSLMYMKAALEQEGYSVIIEE
ncbi:MAG: hypothetical protein EHM12_09815 [Dehalococcoidia bacterium]|nr:MAG: hypothetical protein EHM12_09815 [Dehalococcoidia bacterium]